MKFVCTADTHDFHRSLAIPVGDVFIHAGDVADRRGKLIDFNQMLEKLPHKYKLIIRGNHDLLWGKEHGSLQKILTNGMVLNNSGIRIEEIKIWGTPWMGNIALIPEDTDILVSHVPPWGIGDLSNRGIHKGSRELLEKVKEVKPKYHIFGHVHEGYGVRKELVGNREIVFMNVVAIIGFGSRFQEPKVFEL
ncbi:MAG: metallophosphoesterase [Candidatus Heimdallarchaeota archaeon]|nr:metallophosphoesterase [Candidatus Heimdallarchaeota archaeon]